jgi:UDP-3-O-[3-hydroxymyristoyl] glucosamine N-acyltransferase
VRDAVRLIVLRARTRGRLHAARDVRVGSGVRVRVDPGARVVLGPGARLGSGSRIEARGGDVRVGPGARLGERAIVVSEAGVSIGARAVIGDWAVVEGGAPSFADVERPVRAQPLQRGFVEIGPDAVLGPHAAVGPGAVVAPGRVVGPYAVVAASASAARRGRRTAGR